MLIFMQIIQIYLNVTCNVKLNTLLQDMLRELMLPYLLTFILRFTKPYLAQLFLVHMMMLACNHLTFLTEQAFYSF